MVAPFAEYLNSGVAFCPVFQKTGLELATLLSFLELMPAAICDFPYEGAKEMLLVDEIDNKEFLAKLFEAMYKELSSRS